MIKVIGKQLRKLSQSNWLDEIRDVDWGRDDIDWPPGSVNDENFQDYLADDLEEPPQPQQPSESTLQNPNLEPSDQPETYMDEIPRGSEALGVPEDTKEIEYTSSRQLIYDGIDNTELVSFDYTNRHGAYAGLRTVEPHYTFIARSTGNEILVTYDRDVDDIRAFIVGNIHPKGVRYDGVKFQPRPEIMTGVY